MWFTPLLLFLVSFILLMFSLYQDVEQMRGCTLEARDPSTQAHIIALKSLTLHFIFYILHVLSLIISVMMRLIVWTHWYWVKEKVAYEEEASSCSPLS
ncbi:Taste receptor type 2 member 143 [Heterocephalus glaber]|uniref:Taste receptor type 2 member 143 n=1 Tax=Heterocephalus glaber TaxID=10181 RepID=G5C2M4_HETGA|nr:Taste receptor type 2 member 143 [Heterocephalus glaber]